MFTHQCVRIGFLSKLVKLEHFQLLQPIFILMSMLNPQGGIT